MLFRSLLNSQLVYPENNSSNISIIPSFEWSIVDNATNYTFQLSTNSSFSSYLINTQVSGSSYQTSLELEYNTLYYWRVKANNNQQESEWSETYRFTTQNQGNLFAWGDNGYGQLGIGVDTWTPHELLVGSEWKYLANYAYHTLAIKYDGTLWACGDNEFGQLGDGTNIPKSIPIQIGTSNNWLDVSCGGYHSIGIKRDGTLWAWGRNWTGQLGDGTETNRNTPVQIGNATNWVKVSCGWNHCLALKNDGTLWAWGGNYEGPLGDDNIQYYSTIPIQIGTDTDWALISSGGWHSLAIKNDGTLWTWGLNDFGELGDGTNSISRIPIQIGTDTDWRFANCGAFHTLAIKQDGTLWSWGYNFSGQLGDGTNIDKNTPVQVGSDTDWNLLSSGFTHSMAIKNNGTLWSWGGNTEGELGNRNYSDSYSPIQVGTSNDWEIISSGGWSSFAINSDKTLWSWGYNANGQLGYDKNSRRTFPEQISSTNDWSQFSNGGFTIAIKNDGTLWGWGDNYYGELGDGTNISKNAPAQIGNESGWASVSCGLFHSLALKSDGTLWSWGFNLYGMLGDGTETDRNTPGQIGVDNNWNSFTCGYWHNLAIKDDGTLWAWGENYYGELGDGTNTNSNIPIQIGTETDWSYLSCGEYLSLAIKSDGSLWGWGFNGYGQVGDGTEIDKNTPVQIGTSNDWAMISCGRYHCLAIKNDGTLWAWGYNEFGQIGNGTTTNSNSPIQIGTSNNWLLVSCGAYHTLALKDDGTLWAWGYNYCGEIGNWTTTIVTEPVQIGNKTDWTSISSGYFFSLGMTEIPHFECPWLLTTTLENHTIIVPENINPTVAGRSFQNGDAIGFFFDRDGQSICGGFGIWNGNNFAITVWGDDEFTPTKDGFDVGENFQVKVWDSKDGVEIDAIVTYRQGDPTTFQENGITHLVGLDAPAEITIDINLTSGWNLISSWVTPKEPNMNDVFADIDQFVVLAKNGQGQLYYPEYSINGIGNWNIAHGYQVYVTQASTLQIYGLEAQPNENPLYLPQGWNIIGYIRNSALSIVTALSGITDNIVLVKNNAGQLYFPEYDINTIGTMTPGQGYQMYVTTACTLTYPENYPKQTVFDDIITPVPKHLIPEVINTGNNEVLIIQNEYATDGTEAGVWTKQGILIGSGVFHNGKAAITIWGDNELTEIKESVNDNELLTIMQFNPDDKSFREVKLKDISDVLTGLRYENIIYKKDALLIAKAEKSIEFDNFKISCIPNPANDKAIIEYELPRETKYTIDLYDIQGKHIQRISEGTNRVGTINFSTKAIESGVYSIILRYDEQVVTEKIIVIK